MLQALAGEAGYLAELFGSSEAYPDLQIQFIKRGHYLNVSKMVKIHRNGRDNSKFDN